MPDHRRRDFLGWLGASTLAAAAAGRLRAQSAPAAHDRSAMPHPHPSGDTWDVSWVDHIQGDARAVFDSPAVSDGDALWRAVQWRKDYVTVYPATMEQAEAEARSHLIPGIILQPSGIFAALRAQQAGCSYIMAS